MKKTRIAALLLALLLALSMVAAASAEKALLVSNYATNGYFFSQYYDRMVSNGDTVSFELFASPYSLMERDGDNVYTYSDIYYDFAGKLTASSTADWVRIKNGSYGFTLGFESNYTKNVRSATVKVKGSGFKATLKFKQYGADEIVSIKRNKNKVTVKFNSAKGSPGHYFSISSYRYDDDGFNHNKPVFSSYTFSKSSYTFKVKAGWRYSLSVGTSIPTTNGFVTGWTDGDYLFIDSVSGSETYR